MVAASSRITAREAVEMHPAFDWFDVARAVAAMLVVAEHARDLVLLDRSAAGATAENPLWQAFYLFTGFGHEAVMVFFVLSGYWIASSVHRRADDPQFWRSYFADRLSRLWIVLLPALAIGGLCDWIGAVEWRLPIYAGEWNASSLDGATADRLNVATVLGNAAFLQSLAVPVLGSNGPLWSLAYEFWYYVWFPALYLSWRHRRPQWLLISLVIGAVWPEVAAGFLVWMMGAAIFHIRRSGILAPGGVAWLLGSLIALGFCATASRLGLIACPLLADLATGASFAAVIWGLLTNAPSLPSLFRPVKAYGTNSSYSLYAVHYPPLALGAGSTLTGAIAPGGYAAAIFGTACILSVGAGWLFSLATERHTAQFRALAVRLVLRG